MKSYEELPGFRDVYLEDSFVLAIDVTEARVRFDLEVVLRTSHANYCVPRPGEQYCFRRGTLEFPRVRRTEWIEKHVAPSIDASGSRDFGNVDEFVETASGVFKIGGDWGVLMLESDTPVLQLTEE